ncbi:MAG TPA: glycosyltransferase family 4 protein [Dehalococcoidia bacterium]|nr:glycosyltransferase family 4 protein [Dehalococcoidia bacterium]
MRVALVSVNFWPEVAGIGPYARAYADLLHAAGHDVLVITSRPHYPEWRVRDSDDTRLPYPVRRLRHYIPARPTALRRMAFELSFGAAVWRALRAADAFGLALAVSPSLAGAAAAARVASARGVPFGLIVQDVVSAAPEQSATGRALARPAALLETYALRQAALVGVVSEAFAPRLVALGARPDRVRLVRNWPLSERPFPPHDEARRRAGFAPDEVVCVHAGNMGAKQGLETAVEAAALAERRGLPLRFVLIGDGNQRERLQRMARSISQIEIRPLLPEAELFDALAGADVLLLSQRASVTDMALPSKLTTYVRSGTPIVAAVAEESATARELGPHGAALLIPPERPDALVDAILRVARDPALRASLLEGARAYRDGALARPALEAAFLSFVAECASGEASAAPAPVPTAP